ncbi:unnamed protein product [Caenorhabditis auriculariae]|uniref:Uncharacterized protein n=1 Tax=Caenorhabditis auriculariae TaxID=2777116 RepID=A0A8S1HRQ9_9PELO|nr:unnamed protein product [Caenorhabditis auriculariae]
MNENCIMWEEVRVGVHVRNSLVNGKEEKRFVWPTVKRLAPGGILQRLNEPSRDRDGSEKAADRNKMRKKNEEEEGPTATINQQGPH